jgi:MEMO1 family protein
LRNTLRRFMHGPIRKAAVAGFWYPGTRTQITAEIGTYLAGVEPIELPGRLVALISPHAALRYSGPVAAHGYAHLRDALQLSVVLVGPSHRSMFDGVAVYAHGTFETPLGSVPVDDGLAAALVAEHPSLRDLPQPHRDEHSLEMQLPFLQCLVPELRIVPALMGGQSREEVEVLARALAKAVARARSPVLLVASSDLSHYHPGHAANRLDALVVDDVRHFEPDALMDRFEASGEHACGGGPMVSVMKAAQLLGADRSLILRYGDSGDAGEHDKSRVVGYLSAALCDARP